MIEVKMVAAQGDILFRRRKSLPKDVEEVPRENGRLVVAHSETGHHHSISDPEVRMFRKLNRDPFVCYLQFATPHCDVEHERAWDTHETLRLLGGKTGAVWEGLRQREHAPEGLRRVED